MTGTHTVSIAEEFGTIAANGAAAIAFRNRNIDPYLSFCDNIVIDFTGVRSANSSFVNALVTGLVEDGGEAVELTAGSSCIFPIGWKGVWTVRETLRKVFVVYRTA